MPSTQGANRLELVYYILVDPGRLEGETARSSLMQSLARWKGAGLVQVDTRAPRNFPLYSLTPAGWQAWEGAVTAAREQIQGLFEAPPNLVNDAPLPAQILSQGSNTIAPSLPLGASPRPASKKMFECPRCSTAVTVDNLRQRLQRAKEFTCETCGRELTDEFLDSIEVRIINNEDHAMSVNFSPLKSF